MLKGRYVLMLVLTFLGTVRAQENAYTIVDELVLHMPDSTATSPESIAEYINTCFQSKKQRARAIYTWITENIHYNTEDAYFTNKEITDINAFTLKHRKGVCQNYSTLFHTIAKHCELETYLIAGYTKMNRKIVHEPHVWCGAKLDGVWYTFDPTWGSGTLQDDAYVKKRNYTYFMLSPKRSIRTHMPFDPLWQFLPGPWTHDEFKKSKQKKKKDRSFFNFSDTLRHHLTLSETQRLIEEKRRIENNGITNYMIFVRLDQLDQQIKYQFYEAVQEKFDLARYAYKECMLALNQFNYAKSNRFSRYHGEHSAVEGLEQAEVYLDRAEYHLSTIKDPNEKAKISIDFLHKSCKNARKVLEEQQAFVQLYWTLQPQLSLHLFGVYPSS